MLDLRSLRISSIDSESQRFLCKQERHFGLQFVSKFGQRKLYFLSHAQMVGTLNFILLKGQKFKKREDQYKIIDSIPMNLVHERFIVKHRVTHEKFLMKIITDEAAEEIKLQVNTELLAL